ncbi:MAG: ornithine carbamoyltransferase [Sphingomonadales bacterium]
MPRHFLDLDQFDRATLRGMLTRAADMKAARAGLPRGRADDDRPLDGHLLVMVFEKSSTRTRTSFDVAMRQLGGQAIVLTSGDTQLGRGETIADTARVLSRYGDAIMLRTGAHQTLLDMARHAAVPVINGLTDYSHPCQILADLQTFEEHRGPVTGRTFAWCGDGNNVAVSWVHAAVRLGFELRLACPAALRPPQDLLDWAAENAGEITLTDDPAQAVNGADCVITDTWVSMGQADARQRCALLEPYQVNGKLMAAAADEALFMHCLPAHRGEEVTDAVLDGPQSVVWDEAENRLHAQKAVLLWCFDRLKVL